MICPEKSTLLGKKFATQEQKERFASLWLDPEAMIKDMASEFGITTSSVRRIAKYLNLGDKPSREYDPTPEEIAEECRKIRAGWTRKERAKRLNNNFKPLRFTVPNYAHPTQNPKSRSYGSMVEIGQPTIQKTGYAKPKETTARENDRLQGFRRGEVSRLASVQKSREPLQPEGLA